MVPQCLARSGVYRCHWGHWHGLGQHLWREFVAQGNQQGHFGSIRQTRRLKIAADKIPTYPLVGVVEQLAVDPLKIDGQPNGFAHAHILEFC